MAFAVGHVGACGQQDWAAFERSPLNKLIHIFTFLTDFGPICQTSVHEPVARFLNPLPRWTPFSYFNVDHGPSHVHEIFLYT
ncbi:hypothetical protein PIB30_088821, partial [Stylosanthes scabra]|nr:hypothetical protein [Stylosanthes scabra]